MASGLALGLVSVERDYAFDRIEDPVDLGNEPSGPNGGEKGDLGIRVSFCQSRSRRDRRGSFGYDIVDQEYAIANIDPLFDVKRIVVT
jgi:hypothetical protein